MHPLAGTKRGAVFHNATEETHIVSGSLTHSKITTSQAHNILKAHYQVKGFIDELPTEESWMNLPDVPRSEEILGAWNSQNFTLESEEWNEYQNEPIYYPELPQNVVNRPWQSTKEYIAAHYKILREDAIASLRNAVQTFKCRPNMLEEDKMYIYTEVTITGWFLTRQGPACRVEFCVDRSERRVRWEQSRRLLQGNIVALSNSNNLFKTDCRIAVVAGRSIEGGLDQSPPTIDLFFGDNEKIELDPHEKYVMLEAREGYFEASRHMLIAMQKLVTEKFPLQNEIVFLDQSVNAPQYLLDQPCLDLTWLKDSGTNSAIETSQNRACEFQNVNVLHDFPFKLDIGMDESQMQALHAMITRSVAIVQGPPGTGKTHVSVSALGLMISNLRLGDPPIIVAAQTNHALDQLLNHVMKFEPNILRLGGQSARTNTQIRERTLYELHLSNQVQGRDGGMGKCRKEFSRLVEKIKEILAPLLTDDLLSLDQLIEYKVITEKQRESFSAANWVGNDNTENEVASWLGDDQIMSIKRASPVNLGLPLEEDISEYEKKIDVMEIDKDLDDQLNSNSGELFGSWIPYLRKYTGRHVGAIDSKKWRKRLSKIRDIYEIHENERGIAYRYFEMRVNSCILKTFKCTLKEYQKLVHEFQIARALRDIELLTRIGIKVIGCTTSGLAKYRGLLSAIQPRILLIEEAAETLEGKVMAGTPESIQQIIMVGDHQQLQASCTIRRLEEEPYNMKVSMFERLINNNIGYVILKRQRRMIKEIRKLLCIEPNPFYKNLYDHEFVLDRNIARPPVPGMGGKDTYFFHHNWPEARNLDGSCYNGDEAEMVVAFFNYLYLNGLDPSKITILTFYKGQKNLILKNMRNHAILADIICFNVHTVDGYQGEENDVILLSLVRSNTQQSIGFLDNKNRLVVALSRARRGLYLFGNSVTLTFGESDDPNIGREPLWLPLILYMGSQRRYNLDEGLPITCSRHQTITMILEARDFAKLSGGCTLNCDREPLPCHHKCPLKCHAFEHGNLTICTEPCSATLICGHLCSRKCSIPCSCDICDQQDVNSLEIDALKINSESQNSMTGCLGFFSDEKNYCIREVPIKPIETTISKKSTTERLIDSTITKKGNKEKAQDFAKVSQISSPESQITKVSQNNNKWRRWDAYKADHMILEQQKVRNAHKITNSPIEYHDSHKSVVVRNGQRTTGKVSKMIIETTNPEPDCLKTKITANSNFMPKNLHSQNSTTNFQEKSTEDDQLLIDLRETGNDEHHARSEKTKNKINTLTGGSKKINFYPAPEKSTIDKKESKHLLD